MEKIITKYPYFEWKPEWLEKIHELNKGVFKGSYNALVAIVEYGLNDNISLHMDANFIEYFNKVIKPDLDKQHMTYIHDNLPFKEYDNNHNHGRS